MSYSNVQMVGIDCVPLPEARGGRPPKYPYKDLKIGQSFLAAGLSHINTKSWSNVTGFVGGSVSYVGDDNNNSAVAPRPIREGVSRLQTRSCLSRQKSLVNRARL